MPFKSDAQRKFFNANRAQLEKQGVDVSHWNEESKGMDLPEHIKKHGRSADYLKHLYKNRKK